MKRFWWLALILLIFTACTATMETAAPPQPSPETAVLPTATVPPPVIAELPSPTPEATTVPDSTQPTATTAIEAEPTAEEVAAETGATSGRTEEGAFFLGDANAPITHIDYSDFL
jgi:hypothetical protein